MQSGSPTISKLGVLRTYAHIFVPFLSVHLMSKITSWKKGYMGGCLMNINPLVLILKLKHLIPCLGAFVTGSLCQKVSLFIAKSHYWFRFPLWDSRAWIFLPCAKKWNSQKHSQFSPCLFQCAYFWGYYFYPVTDQKKSSLILYIFCCLCCVSN